MRELLSGVKVLDLTRLLPGGFCSRLLADLGADVIKVEETSSPDRMRLGAELSLRVDGVPVFFAVLHRGKRGLAINLKDPRGKAAFLRLAESADVLLEGFRPGVMERLSLSYRELKAVAPRLVYCSLTGYGQAGPYRERAGHDLNYQAIAGTLSLSADPGDQPQMPDLSWADLAGGAMAAAMGILAGLFAARSSGMGTHIDAAMLDGMLLLGMRPTTEALLRHREPRRSEQLGQGVAACYNIYRTRDGGYISVGALEPKFWQALCNLLGRPDLVPIQWEMGRQEEIKSELGAIFATKTRDEWARLALTADCCLEPVLGPGEAARHPQVAMRGYLYPVESDGGRSWYAPGLPPGLAGRPPGTELAAEGHRAQRAPGWGEHSREVLLEAGLTESEVETLAVTGVIRSESAGSQG